MPAQGRAETSNAAEIVLPFESKVKNILTLLDQSAERSDKDKRFLKDNKPAFVSGDGLEVLNACLSAVTVLSFLGGPEGIVLSSGIVLFQGLLNTAAQAGKEDPLTVMSKALQKIHEQDQTKSQLSKVKSVANTIQTQWKAHVDDIGIPVMEKMKIDDSLRAQTGAAADSLGSILFQIEDLLRFDDTDVRVCVLASLTYYFVVWNLQCRLWASLVRMEARKGEQMDLSKYESYVSTFRVRVMDMKNELSTRTARVKQKYWDMRIDRIYKVSSVETKNFDNLLNNNITTHVMFRDYWTEKEYMEVAPTGFWSFHSSQQQIEDTRTKKNNERDIYITDLVDFVTRSLANDLKVVEYWAEIVSEAEQLLVPPAPKVPPVVDRYHTVEKDKVHEYLKDAHWVAYAYSVGTVADGDSDPSPWTDWIELKTDAKASFQLPVLVLRDSNLPIETRRTIYHRKEKGDKPLSTRPEQTPKGSMMDDWKSEIITAKGSIFWIDP